MEEVLGTCFTSLEELLATVPENGLSTCPVCPEDKFQSTW